MTRRITLLALLATAAAVPAGVVSSSSAATKAPLVDFGLFEDSATVKPARIFLSANSGPYIGGLKWTGWGSPTAVGKGTFISECASCLKERKPVTVTFRSVGTCKKQGVRVYRYQRFQIRTAPGDAKRVRSLPSDLSFC